jgi:hypothetical protein
VVNRLLEQNSAGPSGGQVVGQGAEPVADRSSSSVSASSKIFTRNRAVIRQFASGACRLAAQLRQGGQ